VGERVARVLIERGGEFEHGFTYSGHPVGCAVGLANLALIEQQGLVQRVREDTGPYLAERLATVLDHPIVGDVQSCGLMAAIQLSRNSHAREAFAAKLGIGLVCRRHCFENGLVMRAVGDRMIIAPPLIITRTQIDEMFALIRQALDRTFEEAQAAGWLAGATS
jgi:putrescine---pyruvate transaminase